jgi:AbrB family looped-hinge helix DNA binding protein
MVTMTEPKDVSVQIDEKGRITLPAKLRQLLSLESGDTLFVRLRGDVLELMKAENPFDALARHALKEYREGHTRDLREIARDWGVDPNHE